jgi:4-amino-4-deoxy-L-arabinose transferase-like glycosyltransferase
MAMLVALPATWAVWRAAALLFKDDSIAASAALLFNLTTVMTVGSLAATSDPMVVMTSAFLLYFLAKLNDTQCGEWWLAVGVAFGLGMFSKYTTLFFAVSIFAWLCLVPINRKWFLSPWTWAGGLIAAAIFSPVFLWNANHHWASFDYQAHRMVIESLSLRYVVELIGSQLVLATPPIFILGAIGLVSGWNGDTRERSARILIAALIAPISIYFMWHALHQRVQGNWPEPIYPAFAIAASLAAHRLIAERGIRGVAVRWSKRLAAPVGFTFAAAVFIQAAFGVVPLGRADPTARVLAIGWQPLAKQIDAVREQSGIPAFATMDYTTAGWLTFYLPSHAPVVQLNERIHWIDAPQPSPELLSGPLLFVCKNDCPYIDDLKRNFSVVERLASFTRERDGSAINSYTAYRLEHPTRPVLDPVYPPMNLGGRDLLASTVR